MRRLIFLTFLSISLLFLMSSCSFFKSNNKPKNGDENEDIFLDSNSKDAGKENKAADDFFSYKGDEWKDQEKKADAPTEVASDNKKGEESKEDSDFFGSSNETEDKSEKVMADKTEDVAKAQHEVHQKKMPREVAAMPIAAHEENGTMDYKVKKGDTLMWIAFKVYGDYRQWKKISKANGGITSVAAGMNVNCPNVGHFQWNPKGLPYLIKGGDTLGIISGKVYGQKSKWKLIYDNNRDMIRNPNLIFSGFTLYYLKQDNQLAANDSI